MGSVGSAAVQLATSKGCRVFIASRGQGGDINTSDDPELTRVASLTGSQGVNVVIDTVGQPALMKAALGVLAKRGRLSFIAAPRNGSTEIKLDMQPFYREEKVLIGCNSLLYSIEEFSNSMRGMTVEFEKGVLKPVRDGEWASVPLDDGVAAYAKAQKHEDEKFVIVME